MSDERWALGVFRFLELRYGQDDVSVSARPDDAIRHPDTETSSA